MGDENGIPAQEESAAPAPRTRGELGTRAISAVVAGLAAIAVAWLGGLPFILFWALAAGAVWWEWLGIVQVAQRTFLAGVGAVVIAIMAVSLAVGAPAIAFVGTLIGAAVVMSAAQSRRAWVGGGLFYAAAVLIPVVMLREHAAFGFIIVMWLFAAVWATDTGAYFAGRAFGGPKLAPSISPKKTWSGAVGGTLAGLVASQIVLFAGGVAWHPMHTAAAFLVIVAAQLGDLFESGIKRRFAVKDASTLLPGHGGVMDRLDGFLVGALVALVVGLIAGGVQAPAAGLLSW
jgi:phosphatidate cytidylyltransferase